jgi:hypothetical protein
MIRAASSPAAQVQNPAMDIETTGRVLQALAGTYVELSLSSGGPESWNVRAVNAEARRAVASGRPPRVSSPS